MLISRPTELSDGEVRLSQFCWRTVPHSTVSVLQQQKPDLSPRRLVVCCSTHVWTMKDRSCRRLMEPTPYWLSKVSKYENFSLSGSHWAVVRLPKQKRLQRLSETTYDKSGSLRSEGRYSSIFDVQLHWRLCRRSWYASDWREAYECQPSAVSWAPPKWPIVCRVGR